MANLLYPKMNANPAAIRWQRPENPYHSTGDPRYPVVATTFRLTEHHTAGGMSRTLPWLVELQPGSRAHVARISEVAEHEAPQLLSVLGTAGLVPGVEVEMRGSRDGHWRIAAHQDELELDEGVAAAVWVEVPAAVESAALA